MVVINFLNERNAADVRVCQLLKEKSKLFNGVFGASNEVLGTIESGVDFEKRIVQIYQNCLTEADIQDAFDCLRADLEASITQRLDYTHQQLFENFDEEVLEKIKFESERRLDSFERKFWDFSRFALAGLADLQARLSDMNALREATTAATAARTEHTRLQTLWQGNLETLNADLARFVAAASSLENSPAFVERLRA